MNLHEAQISPRRAGPSDSIDVIDERIAHIRDALADQRDMEMSS